MKKVLKKFNRTLSIMLAAAMVLTMVPQTAMPVLAANEGVEAMAETTPDDVVENEETTTPDDEESTDVADADDTENSGDSDATEGEDGDTEGDNETPVIDEGENTEDNGKTSVTDEGENAEGDQTPEEPAEEDADLADSEESDAFVNSVETKEAEIEQLAAPVITAKQGDKELVNGDIVINSVPEGSVIFTLAKAEGASEEVELYYTVDGSDPVLGSIEPESGGKYTNTAEVQMDPPDEFTEQETVRTFKAVSHIPAKDGVAAQTSGVTSFQFTYTATAVELNADIDEKDTYTKYNMFTVTLDAKDQPTVGNWDKTQLKDARETIKVPAGAPVDVTIEPTEGYLLEEAYWGESQDGKKPNADGKIVFTGKAAEVNTGIMVRAKEPDAPVLTELKVYAGSFEHLLDNKAAYSVDPWETYWVETCDQYGMVYKDAEISVKLVNETVEPVETPSYSDEKLEYSKVDGTVMLLMGGGTAGKKVEVTAKAGTKTIKATLNVGKVLTKVELNDAKLGGEINQAPGTIRTYAIKKADAKSADGLSVAVKNDEADGKTNAGDYIKASVSGNSLVVTTEKTNETVKAKLVFVNESKKTVTDDAEVGSVSLTVAQPESEGAVKYADKLTLKKTKAASGIYTGQTAVIATVDFGKDTYNRGTDVEIYDIPEGFEVYAGGGWHSSNEEVVALADGVNTTLGDDLEIKVRVAKYAPVGKQTIKVRTTYLSDADDRNVVQATASMPVTVVRGIEDIDATSAPNIYREGTGSKAKVGTTKIAVAYNTAYKGYADAKSAAPKTKKVRYEVGECFGDEDFMEFAENKEVLGTNSKGAPVVTVKNGTVTVDKEYDPSSSEYGVEFAVRVIADDFAGNSVDDVVKFTVTGEAAPLAGGEVKFVDKESGIVAKFDKDGKGNNQFTVNTLQTLKAIVVKKGAQPKSDGTYDVNDIVACNLYTMTPVKGNVVVDAEGYITVNKLAKNVQIVATANDGSKNNKVSSEKFNVIYDDSITAETARVYYEVDYGTKAGFLSPEEPLNLTGYPVGSVIHLSVFDDMADVPLSGTSVFDLKLAAANAKIVKKSADNLELDIILTKDKATVTLSDAKATANSKTPFEIQNDGLNTKKGTDGEALKKATPTVSLAKGLKVYAGVENQKLSFTMNKTVADARYVVVSAQNRETDTDTLLKLFEKDKIAINPAVKEFTFTCKNEKMPTLKKGASIAFTFLDRDSKVITQTTKALTIKTTVLKKSYKLDGKYTLSETDAVSVPLTDKRSAVRKVEFTKLYNANIKGVVNHFKEGFELDKEHGSLKMLTETDEKGEITAVARKWEIPENKVKYKDSWKGFVECKVTYEDGTTDTIVSQVQVALAKKGKDNKIATAKKYKASAVNVLYKDSDMTGDTLITIGKLPAGIKAAYAVADDTKNKNTGVVKAFEVLKVTGTSGAADVAKINGNAITLKVKSPNPKTSASYKGDLYIIPADSAYAKQEKLTDAEIEEYGVKLAITVNVKAPASKGKIKVTAKSVSFLGQEPQKLMLNGESKEYYYAEIPYAANIAAEITTVDLENANMVGKNSKGKDPKEDKQNGLVFDDLEEDREFVAVKANNKNALGLYISAKDFQDLVIDDPKWSGSVFSKVKVTVHFADETPDPKNDKKYSANAPESFNISMTMPNPLPIEKSEKLLGRALEIIRETLAKNENAKVDGIKDVRYSESEKLLTVIADKDNLDVQIATAMRSGTDDAIAEALLADDELKNYVDALKVISVTASDDKYDQNTTVTKDEQGGVEANVKMLKELLAKYTNKLVGKLEYEGHKDPTWADIRNNREFTVKITATGKGAFGNDVTDEASCTVRFTTDDAPDEFAGYDDLDIAIKKAVRRLNRAMAIPGIGEIEYTVNPNTVTIHVADKAQNIVASKNAGRDSTVQILLGELGEHMDSVEAVKFSQEEGYVTESVTIKREAHEATEAEISELVDKWTDLLAKELGTNATYGRLIGKVLTVTTNPGMEDEKTYTIMYQ